MCKFRFATIFGISNININGEKNRNLEKACIFLFSKIYVKIKKSRTCADLNELSGIFLSFLFFLFRVKILY